MKVLFALVALIAGSDVVMADDGKLEGDLKALQGKWSAMVGPNKEIPIALEFTGSKLKLNFTPLEGKELSMKAEVVLDEKAKPFPTMDWTKLIGPDGNSAPDNKAIYEIKGDELKICANRPSEERPKEFKAEGPGGTLTLKRVKDDKKVADGEKLEGDLAKIQGQWKGSIGPDKSTLVVEIKGMDVTGTFTSDQNGEATFKGRIKLDEKAKPFPTIDWVKFTGPDGNEIGDNLGIYELKGDTLKVCNGGSDNERPKEFKEATGEDSLNSFVLKRVKDEKDAKSK